MPSTRALSFISLLCAVAAAACSSPADDDSLATDTAALGSAPPITMEFLSDGEVRTSGVALDGAIVRALTTDNAVTIDYDTKRIAGCGLVAKGAATPAHLEVSWRLSGGAIHTHAIDDSSFLGGPGDTLASVSLGKLGMGQLEVWFHATTPAGCAAWDSAGGKNYQFVVHKPAVGAIAFDGVRGHVPATAALPSGGLLRVTYPASRVPGCSVNIEEGQHTVVMNWRFDDHGEWQHASWNSVFGGSPPGIEVPLGAHHITTWFEATDGAHCHDFDSRDGQNYVFPLL